MARGSDKVETSMDSEIDSTLTSGLLLLSHEALVLIIEEFINGHPAVVVVDIIAKTRSVNNGQFDLEVLFLELY